MAVMIPDLAVNEADPSNLALFGNNEAERTVYQALKEQLPDTWTVRYNLVFCYWDNGKFRTDGQADFIVVVPEQGLLFLEVKGADGMQIVDGKHYWIKEDGTRGKETDDPFDQAQGNKHKLTEIIRRNCFKGTNFFPGRYGHMVVFPRCRGNVPIFHPSQVVVCFDGMSELKERIHGTLQKFGDEATASQFTAQKASLVIDHLKETAKFVPVAAADAEVSKRVIDKLTQQQWSYFRGMLTKRRIHVQGVAGSGKTLLAAWTATNLKDPSTRVLFLCYNAMLKEALDSGALAPLPGVEVETFLSLVHRICGGRFTPGNLSQEDYEKDAPIALLEAIRPTDKYDVIIIDEAQDFRTDWWTAVEYLLKDKESRLVVFSDPLQELFCDPIADVSTDFTFHMTQSCRTPQRVTSYFGKVAQHSLGLKYEDHAKAPEFERAILKQGIESNEFSPQGDQPKLLAAQSDPSHRAKTIKKQLNDWLSRGFRSSQMAVLSPWALENPNCSIGLIDHVANLPLKGEASDLQAWRENKCILGTTIKAFKGLEADCVMIVDIPPQGATKGFDLKDLYVASSRAKVNLVLLPSSQPAEVELSRFS
jgi:hypothetical protein